MHVKFKDCQDSCYNSGCNNDLSVGDKFMNGNYQNPSCYTCKYVEHDDGTVEGDLKFFNISQDISINTKRTN